MEGSQPYIALRKSIRRAIRQYRHHNDNSGSVFNPDKGFIVAYDAPAVEAALELYEKTLPVEFQEELTNVTREEELIRQGSQICAHHPSVDARDFAQNVVAYLVAQDMAEREVKPLQLIIDEPPDNPEE